MGTKRTLNTFLDIESPKFGDYLLFQEYKPLMKDTMQVSKPRLAIYLGSFISDQAISFHYVRWVNENLMEKAPNGYPHNRMVNRIESHTHWFDAVDILGVWTSRPGWKEILAAYRKQNPETTISNGCVDRG